MEYMERKIDNIIRRVSSKSRRAARRARRVADESSSGSDVDELSPSLTTPKIEHKTLSNRRSMQKPSSNSKLASSQSDNLREYLSVLGICPAKITYFHIWLAASIYQLQRNLLENANTKKFSSPVQKDTVTENLANSHKCSPEKQKGKPVSPSNETSRTTSQVVEGLPQKLSGYEKACETEDADYVSDYSIYSRPRKSINELDMSMDESIAESSGRESGYLSGIDLSFLSRGGPSSGNSPAISPQGTTLRDKGLFHRPLKLKSFTHGGLEEVSIKSIAPTLYVPHLPSTRDEVKSDAQIHDYLSSALLLRDNVTETKYVTAIFEMTVGGIGELVDDVLNEFNLWFGENLTYMGIACELQWSVPEKYRDHAVEKRMKDALHYSLRQNNRRILDLKNNTGNHMPLTLSSAITEENCGRDQKLNCFQGIYRRFYDSLLPYQHAETGEWHKAYWNLKGANKGRTVPKPNPSQFIYGVQPTKLNIGSIIAVNVIALKLAN